MPSLFACCVLVGPAFIISLLGLPGYTWLVLTRRYCTAQARCAVFIVSLRPLPAVPVDYLRCGAASYRAETAQRVADRDESEGCYVARYAQHALEVVLQEKVPYGECGT